MKPDRKDDGLPLYREPRGQLIIGMCWFAIPRPVPPRRKPRRSKWKQAEMFEKSTLGRRP